MPRLSETGSRRPRLLAMMTALAASFALTSCDPYPVPSDTISIRGGPDGVEIAVCEAFRVETLVFDYRPPGGDWVSSEWHDLGQSLKPSELIRVPASDSLPEGADIVGESDIYVLVNDGTAAADARFVVPRSGLEERWLQPSGALATSPCGEQREN
jgi:hypothetical protein